MNYCGHFPIHGESKIAFTSWHARKFLIVDDKNNESLSVIGRCLVC